MREQKESKKNVNESRSQIDLEWIDETL